MLAGDIMTPKVVTVSPETTVLQVVQLLLARGISGAPVVNEDGALVGVVSEGDLLRRAEIGTQKRRTTWREFFTGGGTVAKRGKWIYTCLHETPAIRSRPAGLPLHDHTRAGLGRL